MQVEGGTGASLAEAEVDPSPRVLGLVQRRGAVLGSRRLAGLQLQQLGLVRRLLHKLPLGVRRGLLSLCRVRCREWRRETVAAVAAEERSAKQTRWMSQQPQRRVVRGAKTQLVAYMLRCVGSILTGLTISECGGDAGDDGWRYTRTDTPATLGWKKTATREVLHTGTGRSCMLGVRQRGGMTKDRCRLPARAVGSQATQLSLTWGCGMGWRPPFTGGSK